MDSQLAVRAFPSGSMFRIRAAALTTAMQVGLLDAVSCLTGGCTAAGFYRGSNFGLNAMAAIRR